jgi:hypothetical protein
LIIGCGFSSSSEKARVRGSNSRPDDASDNAKTQMTQFFLIVVLPWILTRSKLFCQQMHSLLKHKMLQLTLKISLYMAPTCFGPFGPSSGSIRQNLAKVTVFVELLVKIHR